MDKIKSIINLKRVTDSKFVILIGGAIIFIFFFITTNTHLMLDTNFIMSMNFYKDIIIKNFYSLGWLKLLLFYFLCGGIVSYVLKNKEQDMKTIKEDKKKNFIANWVIILSIFLLGIILFSIIKIIMVIVNLEYYGDFSYIKQLFLFILLQFSFFSIFSSIVYFANHTLKEKYTAVLILPFIIQLPIILFSLTTVFTSYKFSYYKYIGELANKYLVNHMVNVILNNNRIEILPVYNQVIIAIIFLVLSIGIMVISYYLLLNLNNKKIENLYYFRTMQILYYIIISTILGYLSSIILTLIIAVIFKNISFESTIFIFNILYIVFIPMYYFLGYTLYKKLNEKNNSNKEQQDS